MGIKCLRAAFNRALKLGYIKINALIKVSFGDLSSIRVKPRENRIQFWSIPKLTGLIKGLPTELES
jgi:hypothetical protein